MRLCRCSPCRQRVCRLPGHRAKEEPKQGDRIQDGGPHLYPGAALVLFLASSGSYTQHTASPGTKAPQSETIS